MMRTLLCAAAVLVCAAAKAQDISPDQWQLLAPKTPTAVPAPMLSPKPAAEPVVQARPATRESLFVESNFQSLTSDRRVHRVGDLVTVLIFENASASSTADTGATRDSSVGLTVTQPFKTQMAGLGTNNDFTGTGRTQRAGKILAQLTVTVREIAPNQDLLLAGEQQLEINGEKQVIRLEGRARPRDISETNTVVSTRVADAKISFIGDGVVADRQRPGWWQYLLGLFGF